MTRALRYLWRHPRRTGFIIFNLIAVAILVGWAQLTGTMSQQGIAGVPNIMLGYTGMALMLVALVAGWIAWAGMVTTRHTHLQQQPPPPDNTAR
jgi:hypothetical protein